MRPADASAADASVLVVGGAGFVGSNLVRELLSRGARRVRVVDNLLSSEPENLPSDPRVELSVGSIADDPVLETIADEFDLIFHLATYHGNQSSIANPLEDHANNTLTTLKLFERVKDFGRLRKLVYAAAGCAVAEKVADAPEATPEDAPISLRMDSPYSISKIVGEFYSVYYHDRHRLPTVRARFQNVYGPGEVLGAGRWRGTPATVWRNVTPTFVYRVLKGLPIEVERGASRDFIFVGDICAGLVACAERGAPGDVYNLASGRETMIEDLADRIARIAGRPADVTFRPARDWDRSGRRFGCPKKSARELGFAATADLDRGLERTVAWTRENLDFIDFVIRRHAARMPIDWLPAAGA